MTANQARNNMTNRVEEIDNQVGFLLEVIKSKGIDIRLLQDRSNAISSDIEDLADEVMALGVEKDQIEEAAESPFAVSTLVT